MAPAHLQCPFWSADSRFLAFFADGKLQKVDASGAPPLTVCDAINGRNGAWNREGVILFSPDTTTVSANPSSAFTAAQREALKTQAKQAGTYFAAGTCPNSLEALKGKPTYVEGSAASPCELSFNGGIGNSSCSAPALPSQPLKSLRSSRWRRPHVGAERIEPGSVL